jgi:transposase
VDSPKSCYKEQGGQKMLSRRSFTKEFKIETVKLATGSDSSVNQIARDMGIHSNTLYRWIKQFSDKPETAFPGKGHVATSEAETIRQLKKENDRLKMERDILKKAMAIFSCDPK